MAAPTRSQREYLDYVRRKKGDEAAAARAKELGVEFPRTVETPAVSKEVVKPKPVESVLFEEEEPLFEEEEPLTRQSILGTPGTTTWFPPPPLGFMPSTSAFDVEAAAGEAFTRSRDSYLARGYTPEAAEEQAREDAQDILYTPRDVEGRVVPLASAKKPEEVGGIGGVIEALRPRVLLTPEQAEAKKDFEERAAGLRERLHVEVAGELPEGLSEEDEAKERIALLRKKLQPWEEGFKDLALQEFQRVEGRDPADEKEQAAVQALADKSYMDFAGRVAPELFEELHRKSTESRTDLLKEAAGTAASRVLGPLMVSEDEETGAISESLLATGMRDLSLLWGSVLDPMGEALTYEVDKQGNVLDPEDYAYRIERLVKTSKKKAGLGEVSPELGGGSTVAALGAPWTLLPRPFQAVEVTPETKSTGDYWKNLARYVEQGRFTGEGFQALPEYQGKWEERGYPNAPYWIGLGVEVALPLSPLSAVPVKGLGRGFRTVASRTAAEAAQAGLETTVDVKKLGGEHTVLSETARHISGEVVQPEVLLTRLQGSTAPEVRPGELAQARTSSVVRDIVIKNTDETGVVNRAGVVADLEDHSARMATARGAGKLSPEVAQAYDTARLLANRFTKLTDEQKQARVARAQELASAGDEEGAAKIIGELGDNVHGRAPGAPVPRDVLTAQFLRAMGNRMEGKPDLKLNVDDFIDRYSLAFRDVELLGDSIEEVVKDGLRASLRDKVPGDMILVTPAVMVSRGTWDKVGGRVVRETMDTFEGTWTGGRGDTRFKPTTPDRVRDALLAALGPGRGEGGYWARVVDDLESGKGLEPDQYLATYNEVLGDVALKELPAGAAEMPVFRGKAMREAAVPVQRRMEMGRLAREWYRALPAGVRKGIEESPLVRWKIKPEMGKTPAAVANWIDEVSARASRLNEEFISDLKAYQKEMGVEDGYQAMINATGVSDDTWGILVRRYFGSDVAIEDELIDMVTKGRRVTPRDLSEVIAELRTLDERLKVKGLRSPVPGKDAPHLFATLTTWMIAVRQNKLVEQSFGEFLTKHPEMGLPLERIVDASSLSNIEDMMAYLLRTYLPDPSVGKTATRTTTREVPYEVETPVAGVTQEDWEKYLAGDDTIPAKYGGLTFPERPAPRTATPPVDLPADPWARLQKLAGLDASNIDALEERVSELRREIREAGKGVSTRTKGYKRAYEKAVALDLQGKLAPVGHTADSYAFQILKDEATAALSRELEIIEERLREAREASAADALIAENAEAYLQLYKRLISLKPSEAERQFPDILRDEASRATGGVREHLLAEAASHDARVALERTLKEQLARLDEEDKARKARLDGVLKPYEKEIQKVQKMKPGPDRAAADALLALKIKRENTEALAEIQADQVRTSTERARLSDSMPDTGYGIFETPKYLQGRAAPQPPLPPELASPPPVKTTRTRTETTTSAAEPAAPPFDVDDLAKRLADIAVGLDKGDKLGVAKKILASFLTKSDPYGGVIPRSKIERVLSEAGVPDDALPGIVQDVVDELRAGVYGPIEDYLRGQLNTWGVLRGEDFHEAVANLRPEIISPKTAEGASLLGGDFKAAYEAIAEGAQSGDLARALEDLRAKDKNLGGYAVSMVDQFLRFTRQGVTGGLLGGFPFNPRYHGVNFLTAPLIIATTLGVPDALKAVAQGVRRLTPWNYARAGKGPTAVVFTDRSGRAWTREMVDQAIARNNIAYGQQAFEFRDGILQDMMRQAQLNPDLKKMGKMAQGWGWLHPWGKNVGARLGETSDNFWRENVFVTALKEGVPEAQAARIAREALLDYSQVPGWARDYAARYTLIFAFRYRMMAETLKMLVRNPNVARQVILASRAQQEKEGLWFTQNDDTLTRLWGTLGKEWDGVKTGLYGPANPPLDSLADLVHFMGWVGGGFDPSQAKEALVEEISVPELALVRDIANIRGDEDGKHSVPSIRVMQLIGTPLWQDFVSVFDIEPKPYDERRAGEPTFTGQQYRFATTSGYNRYLVLEYLLMKTAVKRQAEELARVGIARHGMKGTEGVEVKRYGEPTPVGYALGVETPLATVDQMVARDRALRRALAELKAMAKE